MKIAVAGGRETADYLTGLLREAGHRVAVIQEDRAFCEHLSAKYDMSVTCGDPCREDVLADAGIRGCGLFLALLPEDEESQKQILWSLADSLYSIESVEELRLLADGEELTRFGAVSVDTVRTRPKG